MLTRIRKWWNRNSVPTPLEEMPMGKLEHKVAPFWHAHSTNTSGNAKILQVINEMIYPYEYVKKVGRELIDSLNESTPIFDSMSTYLSESSPIFDKLAMEWA